VDGNIAVERAFMMFECSLSMAPIARIGSLVARDKDTLITLASVTFLGTWNLVYYEGSQVLLREGNPLMYHHLS
jgi:hypothetical protein